MHPSQIFSFYFILVKCRHHTLDVFLFFFLYLCLDFYHGSSILPSGVIFSHCHCFPLSFYIHLQIYKGDVQRFKSLVRLRISRCIQCDGIWMYTIHMHTLLSFIRYDYILLQWWLGIIHVTEFCVSFVSLTLSFFIFYHLCICDDVAAAAAAVAIADDDVGFYFGLESSLEKKITKGVGSFSFDTF